MMEVFRMPSELGGSDSTYVAGKTSTLDTVLSASKKCFKNGTCSCCMGKIICGELIAKKIPKPTKRMPKSLIFGFILKTQAIIATKNKDMPFNLASKANPAKRNANGINRSFLLIKKK
jgi:hypothetical protein